MTRAQIRATVVSSNRQRWIETLRDLIASFCAQAVAAAPMRGRIIGETGILPSTDSETLDRIEAIAKTFTKIRLMINPLEGDHQELVALLTRIVATLRATPLDIVVEADIDGLMEEVVACSQAILKREWVRVKLGQ